MRSPRVSWVAGQRGAALVLALLIFALSAALIVAMTAEFERLLQRGSNIFLAEQTQAYLRGAEGLATLVLLQDYDADREGEGSPRDTLDEIWARGTTPYVLDEGWMEGGLEDLQGRFNLNLLDVGLANPGEGQAQFRPEELQFIRLLLAVAESELGEAEAIAITRAVSDWIDPDSETRPEGAEDDYYGTLEPAYRAANRPMASVSELRAVKGVTPELYTALEPWVTVWPAGSGRMNIHTAPAMVLRSLGGDDSLRPLSMEQAKSLVRLRCEQGFADVTELLGQQVFTNPEAKSQEMSALLGQQSSYFLLRAQAEVAGRHARLYSVLRREDRRVRVLSRSVDARLDPQLLKRENPCET